MRHAANTGERLDAMDHELDGIAVAIGELSERIAGIEARIERLEAQALSERAFKAAKEKTGE